MHSTAPLIAASLMAADFADLGGECRAICAAGADWVHLDIADGHFVPNLTMGPSVCAALRPSVRGVMDVHLMAAPVDGLIGPVLAAGADVISVHLEAGGPTRRLLDAIRTGGARAGLAINPATPVSAVAPLIGAVDHLCVLTVNPGFGGQPLVDGMAGKLAQLAALRGDRPITIAADGGVSLTTARLLAEAGADILIAGGYLFDGPRADMADRLAALRRAAGQSR